MISHKLTYISIFEKMLLVDSKSKQIVFEKRGEKSGDFKINKFFEMHKLAIFKVYGRDEG